MTLSIGEKIKLTIKTLITKSDPKKILLKTDDPMGSSVFSRIFLGSLFVISVLIVNFIFSPIERVIYLAKLKPEVKVLDIDGMSFRDLNKNNKLDRYEDYRLDTARAVSSL